MRLERAVDVAARLRYPKPRGLEVENRLGPFATRQQTEIVVKLQRTSATLSGRQYLSVFVFNVDLSCFAQDSAMHYA